MPKRYRKKPTRRSYRPRRKYGVRKRGMLLNRMPRAVGPPKYQNVKMSYTTISGGTISATSSLTYQWRLNSLFDPDYTGIGYQPYFHDQYSAMYSRYRVYGCKVEMRVSLDCNISAVRAGTVVLVPASDFTAFWTTVANACNSRQAIWRNAVPNQNAVTFKKYFSCADVIGVTRRQYNSDEDYAALCTINPINRCVLNLIIANNDSVAGIGYTFECRLKYYARYYDLVDPAPS